MNNNFLFKHFHYIFVLIFSIILITYLSHYIGLDRHWTAFYDQETILIYNALLFNNGIPIEYTDHPGYFTILFLSFIFKFLSLINILPVYKLSLLTNENFDQSFQNLIFFTRIYSSICISFFFLCVYILFNIFSKNKLLSFVLLLILISSPGTIFHIAQLRTELLAMLFFLISFSFLKAFFSKIKSNKICYLLFFFVFLFFSLLNKMQIFFFIPLFLLPILFCENEVYDFNISKFKFIEFKYFPFLLFILIIYYIYISNHTLHPFPYLSLFVVIINIFCINLIFYFIYKNRVKNLRINLIVLNSVFILVFIIVKSLLSLHPSTSEIIFINLTRVMDMAQYIPDTPSTNEISSLLTYLLSKLIINGLLVFKNIFFELNIYSVLILINIILTLHFRNRLGKRNMSFNLVCLLISVLIIIINSLRSNGLLMPQYQIFSDIFLVLSFSNFIRFLKIQYFVILFIIVFSVNFKKNLEYVNHEKKYHNKIEIFCKNTFFTTWNRKINTDFYYNFCEKNSMK